MEWYERIGRRLKLRDLHMLLVVADAGSMAKSAAQLGVSQPAISKAIASIEQSIGFRLLDRTRNGLVLTDYGRALVRHAAIIFDDLKQGLDELQFIADPTKGELRIGCSESMAAGLLPAIIDHIADQHSKIVLHAIQISFSPLDLQILRERTVELVLGRTPLPPQDVDLEAEILFKERLHIVAGAHSRWARRRRIRLSELMAEPWALPPKDSVPGRLVRDAFRASGLEIPPAAVFTASIHLLANALPSTGRFLSVVPESVLRFNTARLPLKVLPVDFQVEPGPVGIVWLKDRTLSPVARRFLEFARTVAQAGAVKSAKLEPTHYPCS